MIVITSTFEEHVAKESISVDGKDTTRLESRAGIEFQRLIHMIAEINAFLPDDWRMTKSQNNFIILVAPKNGKRFSLAGRSYRYTNASGSERIFHIVATVLEKSWISTDERDVLYPYTDLNEISREQKAAAPEAMQPNLYYFPDWDIDLGSPLYARQYERVLPSSPMIQFHRIHPLTKSGLNPNLFCWVKWSVDGDLTVTFNPDDRYHGHTYWATPEITEVDTRMPGDKYIEHYNKAMKKYGIEDSMIPEPSDTPYEHEYKFLLSGVNDVRSAESVFISVLHELKDCCNRIEPEINRGSLPQYFEQIDTYYDTDNLELHSNGINCRLRKHGKETRITVKARRKGHDEPEDTGWYDRLEEECILSDQQAKQLQDNASAINNLPVQPVRFLKTLLPECTIHPVITVKTHRRMLRLVSGAASAELCLDIVWFLHKGKQSLPQAEIELESKGFKRDELRAIAELLGGLEGVTPSPKAKYDRALEYKHEIDATDNSAS